MQPPFGGLIDTEPLIRTDLAPALPPPIASARFGQVREITFTPREKPAVPESPVNNAYDLGTGPAIAALEPLRQDAGAGGKQSILGGNLQAFLATEQALERCAGELAALADRIGLAPRERGAAMAAVPLSEDKPGAPILVRIAAACARITMRQLEIEEATERLAELG